MSWPVRSMLPVWLIAVAGAVLVGVLSGHGYLEWLPLVMAFSTLCAFVIQLGLRRREGLVSRLAGSLVGALLVLVVASAVLVAVDPAGVRLV